MEKQFALKEEAIAKQLKVLEAADPKRFSNKARSIAKIVENQLTKAKHQVSADKLNVFFEAATTTTASVQNFDPVLIKMLRRALPNLIAYDTVGVQTMSMPTGLVFFQKARYVDNATPANRTEALKDEAKTGFSGDKATQDGDTPSVLMDTPAGDYTVGEGMATATAEALSGTNTNGTTPGTWNSMSLTIDKATVEAKSRNLRADYTIEMAQDLRNVHGIEAQVILADILSNEILVETNREIFRTMYINAKKGMEGTTTPGIWTSTDDSDGRWFQEDAVSLIYWLGKDSNAINLDVRFGRGNFIIVSQNLADVLAAAERLDTHEVKIGEIDGAGDTFIGTVGRFKIFMDPYINDAEEMFACVGFKGATELEAGMFYCPYIGLEMREAMDAATMQPAIAFQSRYGLINNPYSGNAAGTNGFYRKSKIVM